MSEQKKSNLKIVWYVLFACVTVILCYMFTVVYFFYISPYNISLKIGLWPFLSDQAIGEMYLDATVEINFTVNDDLSFDEIEKSVVGVNIRKDGYVIAPYSEFRGVTDETNIEILVNSGSIYNGKLLYSDEALNLSILKCENKMGTNSEVKIPYVSISTVGGTFFMQQEVLAIASPLKDKTVWEGNITADGATNVYKEVEIEGAIAVDFVVEDCYTVELTVQETDFTGGAIFDKNGSVLGLSYETKLSDGTYVIMPINNINLFLNDVVKAYKKEQIYQNELIESVVGFDQVELYCHLGTSDTQAGKKDFFYFRNAWRAYTDDIIKYSNSTVNGLYLYEDFVYNEQTVLAKDKVIVSVRVNRKLYSIENKLDVLNALYNANKGDTVIFNYYEISTLNESVQSVNFEV